MSPSSTTADADSNRVLQALRSAHDAVEQTVANEIAKAFGNSSQQKAQLDEARGQIIALQKDLEKMTQQKNYVADAFEASRKEAARLKTENALANEELQRLRKAVEDLSAERLAAKVGQKAVDVEVVEAPVRHHVVATARRLGQGGSRRAEGDRDRRGGEPAAASSVNDFLANQSESSDSEDTLEEKRRRRAELRRRACEARAARQVAVDSD